MKKVKEYKGHKVPDGATGFVPEKKMRFALFVKDGFFARAGSLDWVKDYSPELSQPIELLPQEPEAYIPDTGQLVVHADSSQWCEYGELFYIGNDPDGFKVMQDEVGKLHKFNQSVLFDLAPIKTEREKFVECCFLIRNSSLDGLLNDTNGNRLTIFFNDMFDNGARFSGDTE